MMELREVFNFHLCCGDIFCCWILAEQSDQTAVVVHEFITELKKFPYLILRVFWHSEDRKSDSFRSLSRFGGMGGAF